MKGKCFVLWALVALCLVPAPASAVEFGGTDAYLEGSYNWAAADKTLTLFDGYIGDVTFDAINVERGLIQVIYEGNVIITNGLGGNLRGGELSITGSGGTLTTDSNHITLTNWDAITIGGNANIAVTGGNISGETANAAITSHLNNVTIKDNASVKVKGIIDDVHAIEADGAIIIDTSGTVEATVSGTGYALKAPTLVINNGIVDITAADETYAYNAAPTFNGGTVYVNGVLKYGTETPPNGDENEEGSGTGGGGCNSGLFGFVPLALLLLGAVKFFK